MTEPSSSAPPPVPEELLAETRARLADFRAVPTAFRASWGRGVDADWLAEMVAYWAGPFDWRQSERRISALPWVLTSGEVPLRVVNQHVDSDAPTVVLLHGWPDSVLRFERLLPRLGDVNVVIPALPGFPFAAPIARGGLSALEIGKAVGQALERLGYERYIVSAGDVGTDVAEALLQHRPREVAALHVTDVSQYHFLHDLPADLTPEEQSYVQRGHDWQASEGGYMHEQSTKPQTLAAGLGDSPAGLLAWIGEKLRSWTDCDGDLLTVFSRDELVTWVGSYWYTGAIGTSFTPYAVPSPKPAERVTVPTVVSVFPKDLVNAPRSFAERFFPVVEFQEHERGGHFAAWEDPVAYEAGVRGAIAAAG